MTWITLGENKGRVALVSKSEENNGILPKGSFLTVEDGDKKFILRVDDSVQNQPYEPSPMIADMDLKPLKQDQKCQNIIYAYRIKDVTERDDGLIDYIRPQMLARRSTQEEVNIAISNENSKGPRVFASTIYSGNNQILIDDDKNYISVNLPEDVFFYQMYICGKTGSGKTVAIKYFIDYFINALNGAVLAINVKESDLLTMNRPSQTDNYFIIKEWEQLNRSPSGIFNYQVYYPGSTENYKANKDVDSNYTQKITLDIMKIDPDALTGLISGITDSAAQSLPNIFRFFKQSKEDKKEEFKFSDFISYFQNAGEDLSFETLTRGEEKSYIKLHRGTYESILRSFERVRDFFDIKDSISLNASHILREENLSVIDVMVDNGIEFGSILLRDLLSSLIKEKRNDTDLAKIPLLIVIDEVHSFYNNTESNKALQDLDYICRTGRSAKMGVIFSSQNPNDIPRGLSSVINTKIFFKSEYSSIKSSGINITISEAESLRKGYAVASIHDLPQIKIMKFPLSLCGVNDKKMNLLNEFDIEMYKNLFDDDEFDLLKIIVKQKKEDSIDAMLKILEND